MYLVKLGLSSLICGDVPDPGADRVTYLGLEERGLEAAFAPCVSVVPYSCCPVSPAGQ